MTPDTELQGMNAVAHRHFSTTTICKYYRYSGTCRYRRCRQGHVLEAISADGPHRHEPLPSVQERPWVLSSGEESSCDEGDAESWRFSVASYNILADKYARHYRSYLYHDVPAGYLDWSHRRSAIIAELAHLQPDIICLQEVDRYEDLETELQQLGYSGIYLQRDGSRRDGCATFWRKSLLRPALVRQLRYSQYDLKDNVALLVLFEPHTAASATAAQQSTVSQQQVQPPMVSPQLLQQQQQEQQSQHRHRQDLLSQWLPRSWLQSSHHNHPPLLHKPLSRAASLGNGPADIYSTGTSIYQQPGDVMQVPAGRSNSWGAGWSNSSMNSSRRHSKSSKHGSRRSSRADDAYSSANGELACDGTQQPQQEEPLQVAPDWHKCGIVVANTHIIFTPDKGEVKLGQARMLIQEAAQMAQWYLSQQKQQQQPVADSAGQPGSSSSRSSTVGKQQQNLTSSTADAIAAGANGVVTVIAGDFNATPNSPMYTFLAHGQVDLHQVNRRNVSHMTSRGNHLHKGYRGFRRVQKRRSVEEQRRSSEQQRRSVEQLQQPQQWQGITAVNSGTASAQNSAAVDAAGGDLASATAARTWSANHQQQLPAADSAGSCSISSTATLAKAGAGNGDLPYSSPTQANNLSSYPSSGCPSPDSPPRNGKLYRWSDKECRRAAGMSYDELLEVSTAAPPAPARQPASPGTKIARAAAAFGAQVAAGAGAAAASAAASAAAEKGGPFEASRGGADGVGRLWLRHDLPLQSSYVSVLGFEPEYTSSHSQFMDTCDYIWYTETALCSMQQQPQLEPSVQSHAVTDSTGAVDTGSAQETSKGATPAAATGYNLKPVAVLVPPDGMRLPKGLPSRWLGSDHVCLVADFELSPKRVM